MGGRKKNGALTEKQELALLTLLGRRIPGREVPAEASRAVLEALADRGLVESALGPAVNLFRLGCCRLTKEGRARAEAIAAGDVARVEGSETGVEASKLRRLDAQLRADDYDSIHELTRRYGLAQCFVVRRAEELGIKLKRRRARRLPSGIPSQAEWFGAE